MKTAETRFDAAPVEERDTLVDSLRAIALYGVITFNIVAMALGFVGAQLVATATPVDMGFVAYDLILIQGKARAAFALLFGVGFGMLMERAAARGRAFVPFYLRRMAMLLAIGLFNLTFLFFGDILILYALLGMTMPLFRGWSSRALLMGGLLLVIVPPLAAGAAEAVTGAPLPNLAGLTPAQAHALMPASAPFYQGDDFVAYAGANLRFYIDHIRADTSYVVIYDLSVLGLFLLGLWTARNRILTDVERWRPFLRRVALLCLPLGLAIGVVHATRRLGIEADGAAYGAVTAAFAGLAITSFGYLALFCLFLTGRGRALQRVLAPMGRMALTGYLASNAIGGFVWYGWGLGMIGRWNGAAMNLFALAIFISLCAFSAMWLRVFRQGPAEWVWRSVTYGKPQRMLVRTVG